MTGPANKNIEPQRRFYSTKSVSEKKKNNRLQKPTVQEKDGFLKSDAWVASSEESAAYIEETNIIAFTGENDMRTETKEVDPPSTENPSESTSISTSSNTTSPGYQWAFLFEDQRPTYALGVTSRGGRQVRLPGKFLS